MKIGEDGKKRKVVYVKIKNDDDFYDVLKFCFGSKDDVDELMERKLFVYDGEYVVVRPRPLNGKWTWDEKRGLRKINND